MDNDGATAYLTQFIGQPLRIHTSDGRVFGGQMKCTDKVRLPNDFFDFLLTRFSVSGDYVVISLGGAEIHPDLR